MCAAKGSKRDEASLVGKRSLFFTSALPLTIIARAAALGSLEIRHNLETCHCLAGTAP